MRGLARLTGHESCMRVDKNYKRFNKMADVSERLSDTQEKPEASDVQVITHNTVIRRRKKENIITYHRQATSKSKEIGKRKRLSLTLMQLSLLV